MTNDKKVVLFSQDFYLNEINGGAEQYAEVLLKSLTDNGYIIDRRKSQDLTPEYILEGRTQHFYIISNFMLLPELSKKTLMEHCEYVILEHDHKYVKSNNPSLYNNFVIPEDQIQNKEFYQKAKYVLCQSKLHAEIIQKNLLLKNIINLGCNLWSDECLSLLQENINKTKTRKFGVMESNNKNKGTPQTIQYCRTNNIPFDFISQCGQKEFYKELSKTETLVFMPQWVETFSRVTVEARILGCKIITNKMLGCASEEFFQLKNQELLDEIKLQQDRVVSLYRHIIDGSGLKTFKGITLPSVSVITTIYKAGQYIKGYLEAFIQQTLENKELIIIDANSPDNEREIIEEYQKKHTNIKYVRLNEQVIPPVAFNIATEMAQGEFIVCCLIDDRMSKDYLEIMSKHLLLDESVDLVYSDHYQTSKPNETFDNNSSKGRLYEHSRNEFSKENMIKSLPGPIQMYRKSVVEKYGQWDETLKYACDWQYWLRMVRSGAKFKKINKVMGLYYFSPTGLSTGQEHTLKKRREEKDVFNEYKDVIGEHNFNLYKDYFNAVE